jgi:hypothetical protein
MGAEPCLHQARPIIRAAAEVRLQRGLHCHAAPGHRNEDHGATCVFRVPSILGPLPSRAEIKACLTKGATIGGDRKALEQAQINVRAQLAKLLK